MLRKDNSQQPAAQLTRNKLLENSELIHHISTFLKPADVAASRQVNHVFNQHHLFHRSLPYHFQHLISEKTNQIKDAKLAKCLSALNAPTSAEELKEFKLTLAKETKDFMIDLDKSSKDLSGRRKLFSQSKIFFWGIDSLVMAASWSNSDYSTMIMANLMFGILYLLIRHKLNTNEKEMDKPKKDVEVVSSFIHCSELVKKAYENRDQARLEDKDRINAVKTARMR